MLSVCLLTNMKRHYKTSAHIITRPGGLHTINAAVWKVDGGLGLTFDQVDKGFFSSCYFLARLDPCIMIIYAVCVCVVVDVV